MPSPKSVSPGNVVKPAAPLVPEDATDDKPGATSVLGQDQDTPFTPAEGTEEEPKVWIEIELVDEEDNPVPGEKYKCTMKDGTVDTGTLDNKGFKRIEGMDPGECQITFPNLDKEAWEKA